MWQSNSYLSRTWHFLTCLDYLIGCLYSQGSLPCNSGSNKNQSTSSSLNTMSCVPSTKHVVHLVRAYFSFKIQFRPKKGLCFIAKRKRCTGTARPQEESQPEGIAQPQRCHRHNITCWPRLCWASLFWGGKEKRREEKREERRKEERRRGEEGNVL